MEMMSEGERYAEGVLSHDLPLAEIVWLADIIFSGQIENIKPVE